MLAVTLDERRHDVLEERLAERCRLLRPVEHGDRANRGGQRGDERGCVERPEEPDLDEADALTGGAQALDRLLGRTRARSHEHEDALGIRVPDVVEEPVSAPRSLAEARHLLLDDLRHCRVVGVDGLARLEEDVGVLGAAAQHRMVGRRARGRGVP